MLRTDYPSVRRYFALVLTRSFISTQGRALSHESSGGLGQHCQVVASTYFVLQHVPLRCHQRYSGSISAHRPLIQDFLFSACMQLRWPALSTAAAPANSPTHQPMRRVSGRFCPGPASSPCPTTKERRPSLRTGPHATPRLTLGSSLCHLRIDPYHRRAIPDSATYIRSGIRTPTLA